MGHPVDRTDRPPPCPHRQAGEPGLRRRVGRSRRIAADLARAGVAEGTDPGTQRELAEALGIEGPTLTHHLSRMEAAGLVSRHRDPDNRRVQRVELTAAGEAEFDRLRHRVVAFDERLRAGLTVADVAALGALLDRLQANVAAAAEPAAAGRPGGRGRTCGRGAGAVSAASTPRASGSAVGPQGGADRPHPDRRRLVRHRGRRGVLRPRGRGVRRPRAGVGAVPDHGDGAVAVDPRRAGRSGDGRRPRPGHLVRPGAALVGRGEDRDRCGRDRDRRGARRPRRDDAVAGRVGPPLYGSTIAHVVVLGVATVLSVFKPRGRTPWGRRQLVGGETSRVPRSRPRVLAG